jgi:hypothetical protein
MAEISPAPVLAYSLDPENGLIKSCADKGWRTITAYKDQLILKIGHENVHSFGVSESEYLTQSASPEKLGWMMAGIAAAWATGISFETIETGIQTFMPEEMME